MNYKVIFLEPAENELIEAVKFYNEQLFGLGFEFAVEIQKTIDRIIKFPNSWVKLTEITRKCRCNRFPYNVIYYIHNDTIVIVAIMHSNREPNYWNDRI